MLKQLQELDGQRTEPTLLRWLVGTTAVDMTLDGHHGQATPAAFRGDQVGGRAISSIML